jgi:hypothetical protein
MRSRKRMVAILKMTDPFQSPQDRVLWLQAHHGGKMKRSRLRAAIKMRDAYLNPVLGELEREGRIKMSGDIITLENII